MSDASLDQIVRDYLNARQRKAETAPWTNLQIKGAARARWAARIEREYASASRALEAAVGWKLGDQRQ